MSGRATLAGLVGLIPPLIGLWAGRPWLELVGLTVLGLSAAATAAQGTDRGSARLALLGALALGLAVSFPTLGIGSHLEVSLGDQLAHAAIWGPAALAVVVADPSATRVLIRAPVLWLTVLCGWAVSSAPLGLTVEASVVGGIGLLAVILVGSWVCDTRGLTAVLGAVAVGLAVHSGMSIALHLLDVDLHGFFPDGVEARLGIERIGGLSAEPIHLGEAGALGALCGALVMGRRGGLVYGAAAAVCLVGALWSQSRGPLLALGVAVGWAVMRRFRWAMPAALVAGGVAIVVAIGLGVRVDDVADLLRRQESDDLTSLGSRVDEVWPVATDAIGRSFVVGHGQSSSTAVFARAFARDEVTTGIPFHSHNRLLDTWVTLGLVGVALWLGALGDAAVRLYRRPFPAAEAVLVYFVVSGISLPGSDGAYPGPVLLTVAAALAATATRVSSRPRTPNRPQEVGKTGPDAVYFGGGEPDPAG